MSNRTLAAFLIGAAATTSSGTAGAFWNVSGYLTPARHLQQPGDLYGSQVAVIDGVVVVGSPANTFNVCGDASSRAGSAHEFRRVGGAWANTDDFYPDDDFSCPSWWDELFAHADLDAWLRGNGFGTSIALSRHWDGAHYELFAGSPNHSGTGATYLYKTAINPIDWWNDPSKIHAGSGGVYGFLRGGTRFGAHVASLGEFLMTTADYADGSGTVVTILNRRTGKIEIQISGGQVPEWGAALAIGMSGLQPIAVIGAPANDFAWILRRRLACDPCQGNYCPCWDHEATVRGDAGSRFGHSVATDGTMVFVGAPNENTLTMNGRPALRNGRVRQFERDAGSWRKTLWLWEPQCDQMIPANAHFGFSIAVSGGKLVVGQPGPIDAWGELPNQFGGQGDAYLYDAIPVARGGGRPAKPLQCAPRDADFALPLDRARRPIDPHGFGKAVAIDGNTVAVGAPGDDRFQGQVCVFTQ
jgi:hypothetical protein